jgi:hypothetical protein
MEIATGTCLLTKTVFIRNCCVARLPLDCGGESLLKGFFQCQRKPLHHLQVHAYRRNRSRHFRGGWRLHNTRSYQVREAQASPRRQGNWLWNGYGNDGLRSQRLRNEQRHSTRQNRQPRRGDRELESKVSERTAIRFQSVVHFRALTCTLMRPGQIFREMRSYSRSKLSRSFCRKRSYTSQCFSRIGKCSPWRPGSFPASQCRSARLPRRELAAGRGPVGSERRWCPRRREMRNASTLSFL